MIIETSCNHFYRVWDTLQSDLDHVWFGTEVKRVKGAWVDKKTKFGRRPELVRKAASRVVEA